MEMTSIESEGRPADAREASGWRTRAGMFYLLKKLEWRRSYETPLHKGVTSSMIPPVTVTRLKTVICHFKADSLCWRDNSRTQYEKILSTDPAQPAFVLERGGLPRGGSLSFGQRNPDWRRRGLGLRLGRFPGASSLRFTWDEGGGNRPQEE